MQFSNDTSYINSKPCNYEKEGICDLYMQQNATF